MKPKKKRKSREKREEEFVETVLDYGIEV